MNEDQNDQISLRPIIDTCDGLVDKLRLAAAEEEAKEVADTARVMEFQRTILGLEGIGKLVQALCLSEDLNQTLYVKRPGGGG